MGGPGSTIPIAHSSTGPSGSGYQLAGGLTLVNDPPAPSRCSSMKENGHALPVGDPADGFTQQAGNRHDLYFLQQSVTG